jgi:S-DNA-T family DNA segregation ATPase FtsK/SpoIIIE
LVRLQDVWRKWRPEPTAGNYDLLVGVREDNGELLFISPGKIHAPHTLIAGSTGSGKSVLVQNLVLGIAVTNTPEYAKIVLIDPKQGVDYLQFEDLPHLQGGIIDDQATALDRLRSLVSEMDGRYSLFKSSRTNSLIAYNQKASAQDRLPAIWVIHDEFAEWMLIEDYKEEVTSLVSRLGVKARAAGIHLIFAAQRPDANVMPMQLRANLGNRLILRVDSEGTSEIALGEKGAERLLGRGHLLAKLEGSPLCYAQVPFAETQFVEQVIAIVSDRANRIMERT